MDDASWLAAKLTYIEALKKPSDQQTLLAILARKPDRTAEDHKTLTALIRAEKAAERAMTAQAAASRLLKSRTDSERKARNYRLIQLGLIIDQAGLAAWDLDTLRGALLEIATQANPEQQARWRQLGQAHIKTSTQQEATP